MTGLSGSEAQTPTAQLGRAYILMLWLAGIIARAAYHDGRCLGKLLGAGKARKYVTSLGDSSNVPGIKCVPILLCGSGLSASYTSS